MRKKVFTIVAFFISFVTFSFISTLSVKAADSCTCYYSWQISGASETANLSSYYFAKVNYNENKATSAKYCMYDYTTSNDGNNDMSTTLTKLDKDCNANIAIDSEFSADYKKIVSSNCSKEACSSAKLFIKANPDAPALPYSLTTKDPCGGIIKSKECFFAGVPVLHKAISQEDFQKGVDSNNDRTSNTDNYIDDIDPSIVVPSDPTIKKQESVKSTCDLIGPSVMQFLKNLFFILQVIGVVLLVVMSMIEFVKALTGSDDDSLRKAFKNIFKRIIITIILLLLPMLIIWVLNIVNSNAYVTDDNGKRIVGANGDPLCRNQKYSSTSSYSSSNSSSSSSKQSSGPKGSASTSSKSKKAKTVIKSYKVLFLPNDGVNNIGIEQEIKRNKTVKLKGNRFENPGFVFQGWNTKRNGKGKKYKNHQKVKNLARVGKKIKLYAQWRYRGDIAAEAALNAYKGDSHKCRVEARRLFYGNSKPGDTSWCSEYGEWALYQAGARFGNGLITKEYVENTLHVDTNKWCYSWMLPSYYRDHPSQGEVHKPGDGYIPQPGDLIIYVTSKHSSKTSRLSDAKITGMNHTRICVASSNGKVAWVGSNFGSMEKGSDKTSWRKASYIIHIKWENINQKINSTWVKS